MILFYHTNKSLNANDQTVIIEAMSKIQALILCCL